MKYLCCALVFLGVVSSSFAQLNSYKYFVVPKTFDIFSSENHLQTSTLIKYLFSEQGYNVIYDDELPPDLVNQRCLGLMVDLEKNSNLTWTRMTILLKDCNSVEIFRSPEGSSRSKDFREAYHESIREAFRVFETMNHNYQPPKEEVVTVNFGNDIKSVEDTSEKPGKKEPVVMQVATPEEQSYRDRRPEPSDYTKAEVVDMPEESADPVKTAPDSWTARQTGNGYELVDSGSEVKLTLYKTSAPDVFLAKFGNVDGMVYKKDSNWYLEYYKDKELIVEELNIKF